MDQYLIFQLNDQKFALPLQQIERVVRVVAFRSVAQSSPHILGVIDMEGKIISVVNFRTLLGFPAKEINLADVLLICQVQNTRCALLVDLVENTEFCETQQTENTPTIPLPESFDHFIKLQDQMIPVYSLEKIISLINIQPVNSGAPSDSQPT